MKESEFKLLINQDMSEKDLQGLCESYLTAKRWPFIHLKNWVRCHHCGRWHGIKNAEGYCDLDCKTPGGNLLVELKTKKGRLSEAQKFFRDKIIGMGYSFFVVRDFETFKRLIDKIETDKKIPSELP